MKTTIHILATARALSDPDLLAQLDRLAGRERETSVELVAHLAVLDTRPSLFAAKGHGSLFAYCTEALRLSEDAACNRIAAARACRRFPEILDLLASGELSLTSVRLLARHLTLENHESVLARAVGRRRPEIDVLVAELAPRPDVPTSVRRLPAPAAPLPPSPPVVASQSMPSAAVVGPPPVRFTPPPRSIVQPTAPERYRVQFTIGQETHDKLRRLQDLLRREIPDGDAAAIVDRALTLMLDKVEKARCGAADRPRPTPVIRPGTDNPRRASSRPSRHIPRAVQRAVSQRDGNRCAFVPKDGLRCTARTFLEFHHVDPYALGGLATVEKISLRCRRHNQYEAELIFGPYRPSSLDYQRPCDPPR